MAKSTSGEKPFDKVPGKIKAAAERAARFSDLEPEPAPAVPPSPLVLPKGMPRPERKVYLPPKVTARPAAARIGMIQFQT